eukprot:1434779-Rhodomonas_salina.1
MSKSVGLALSGQPGMASAPAADKVALAAAAALAAAKDRAQKHIQREARKLELSMPEKSAAAKQEERDEADYDSDEDGEASEPEARTLLTPYMLLNPAYATTWTEVLEKAPGGNLLSCMKWER